MIMRMEWTRLVAPAALVLPLCIGCGSGDSAGSSSSTAAVSNSSPSNTSSATVASGPAAQATLVQKGVQSEASQCVAVFLDSLRRGDERAANGVLTTKAREELAKTAYIIEPLGTPDGEYQIGRVGFPYEEKNIALVECTWTEPPVPGEERLTMDIVCEVHREVEGWRISGMGVSIPGLDEALVLDFEDAASLQATIEAATAPSPSDNQQAPTANQQVSQQMPAEALPGYPTQQEISVENSAPPQLAYPPQYDPQIKR